MLRKWFWTRGLPVKAERSVRSASCSRELSESVRFARSSRNKLRRSASGRGHVGGFQYVCLERVEMANRLGARHADCTCGKTAFYEELDDYNVATQVSKSRSFYCWIV